MLIFALIISTVKFSEAYDSNASISKENDAHCDCTGEVKFAYSNCQFGGLEYSYALMQDGQIVEEGETPSSTFDRYITGLCPGTYNFKALYSYTVDQNGNPVWQILDDQDITIEGPDEFLDANLIDWGEKIPDCYGTGWVNFTVSGGNQPVTISWTRNGDPFDPPHSGDGYHSGLPGGNYTITITDAEGCEEVLTFTIADQYPKIDFDLVVVTKPGCDGPGSLGKIRVVNLQGVSGDIGTDYNVEWWRNGIIVDYDILEKDDCDEANWCVKVINNNNNCYETKCVDLEAVETPLEVDYEVYHAGCNSPNSKGWIELDVVSGTPSYTYHWDHDPSNNTNRAEDLEPGTYTVTITDANGCSKTLEITIEQVPTLQFDLTIRDVHDLDGNCDYSLCRVANLVGTPPFTITWDSGTPTTGDQNKINEFPATHKVTVVDGNGCVYEETITNEDCQPSSWGGVSVNPNPADDILNVLIDQYQPAVIDLDLFDLDFGQVYHSNEGYHTPGLNEFQIDMSPYQPGAYYLVVSYNGEPDYTVLIIKE